MFDGAPKIKIKIKSDSLRIVDTLFVFCRSRLAGEKRESAAFILVSRVIVEDHRRQAGSYRTALAFALHHSSRLSGRCAFAFDFDLRRPPKSLSDYGHTEPRRGTECWGEGLLLTFGPFQK
ncbi:hypothetical protein SOP86_17085 [Pseudomonas canadensis]|uniref:hypothetical protein n=1 Tax=Pseudomonas canadensis TaxID=915099 RepID=UPI002B24A35C|nr:hypothetical protein [Pseudomonas canadensis]MEB2647357.1 hypothetical protein [Pseudomonas canadensis]